MVYNRLLRCCQGVIVMTIVLSIVVIAVIVLSTIVASSIMLALLIAQPSEHFSGGV